MKPTVRMLLESRIHEAFTRAGDQLAARGYLERDERIELSSLIGDVLGEFGAGIEPAVSERTVDVEDARSIAAMVKSRLGR